MFCHVPVPYDILDLVDHLRVFFAHAGYWLSNRTDSRKNTAAALFGLNIDNLVKLSFAMPI